MSFDTAFDLVLRAEGGYTDGHSGASRHDRGGATNYGVTQKSYDAFRTSRHLPLQPVKFITLDEARSLYLHDYWRPGRCDSMPERLATAHFDACVNHGLGRAAKILQACLGVVADGMIGPATLRAIAADDEDGLIREYLARRLEFYEEIVRADPTQAVFIKGWKNRIAHLGAVLKA